jgi:hypothetical protein
MFASIAPAAPTEHEKFDITEASIAQTQSAIR